MRPIAALAHPSDRGSPHRPPVLAARRAWQARVVGQRAAVPADRALAVGEHARLALPAQRADHQRCQPLGAGSADVRRPVGCFALDRLDPAADPALTRACLLKARVAQLTWILFGAARGDRTHLSAAAAAPRRPAVAIAASAQSWPAVAAAHAQLPDPPAGITAPSRRALPITTSAHRSTVGRPGPDRPGLATQPAGLPTAWVRRPAPPALVGLIAVGALVDRAQLAAHAAEANPVTVSGHAA